jgi:hypothetical protein
MPPDSDKDTFSEALLKFPSAVMRLVRLRDSSGRRPSQSCWGCLNPVTIIKIVLLLLLVALLPLFLLPLLIGRMLKIGRTALRYSSVLELTSGAAARWGYGQLDPPSDPGAVQAGAAAIAAHDPEFDPMRLMNWAAAATGLLGQSLTSADATPARTFMANGLFRTYLALLELRSRAEVTCEGSWRATGASVVDAISTPLFDEVRVRLQCEGWCSETHAPTGLTVRGGSEVRAWSEDLTFGRSATAVTPAAGGLPARRCPSCGAPLDLDVDGACRYCHGVVTAGRHDWVLTGWRREPW